MLSVKEFYVVNTTVCLAHRLDITLINENYAFFPNINIDKLLNKMITYVINYADCSIIKTLLSTCGSFVCLKEFSSFSTNDAQTLIAIISLPWMDISNNIFKDLPLYKYLYIIMKKWSTLLSKCSNYSNWWCQK